MDTHSAYKTLGLPEGASQANIKKALADKLAPFLEKQTAAPTDALKQKFASMIKQVNEAAEYLLSQSISQTNPDTSHTKTMTDETNEPRSTTSRSALSQTKLADLPGVAMGDAQQVEFQPGTMLASRYKIKELIGQGGMGAVYRAFDKNRDEDIAIKVLLPSLTKNERA
ncbi:MAG: hypothetical protein RPR91_10145, partial [Colwellia sp.]